MVAVNDENSKNVTKDGEKMKPQKEAAKIEPELSEEDRKLRDDLNMIVDTLKQNDKPELYQTALNQLKDFIRASTTSMTSVPKPLKFMMPHIGEMKEVHEKIKDEAVKKFCADIVSVLMMVSEENCGCLNYRLLGSQSDSIGDWGHEYVRHLCSELAEEYKRLEEDGGADKHKDRLDSLLRLTKDICQYNMAHNAFTEAADLVMEIDRLNILPEFVNAEDQPDVCRYLLSCVPYVPDPENTQLIRAALNLCLTHHARIDAIRCAIMLNDVPLMKQIVLETEDKQLQRQMAIMLGRHQIFLDLEEEMSSGGIDMETIVNLNSNAHLYQHFQSLARELDIAEPKTPEDIYKAHLEPSRVGFAGSSSQTDSAKAQLASAFVNGFVNAGFGNDKNITPNPDTANKWFYKNKEYGIMSAAASTGLIMRWDLDGGINQCDRFLYVNDHYIKAGNLLAMGICSSGIQDQVDPAAAILLDYVFSEHSVLRIGSCLGLGLAYANSKRPSVVAAEEGHVLHELKKVLSDQAPSASPEVKGVAALAIGLISVGTGDSDLAMLITQYLMEKTEEELADTNIRFLLLALGLIFLGTQNASEVTSELVLTLPQPFAALAHTTLEVCAYAGTGNVLKVQNLLHICSEHYESQKEEKVPPPAKKDDKKTAKKEEKPEEKKIDLSAQQSIAALGVGLISMGEDIGAQMAMRSFAHLFRYGEPCIRRAVPLGMAMISVSNPQLQVVETLHKYSHDADPETAYNAIVALGIVGAGSNNARLSNLLRQLAVYHAKDAQSLMLVRIAQGLCHMGKGTMTLSPYHSDRQLMCPVSVAALLICAYAFLDSKNSILNGRQHYLLYCLVPAIQPRMLITLVQDETDPEQLKQVNVPVRVGQAVDNVGQAGKTKSITGFRTHTTPVLLAAGERAELANDDYISLTPYLEGLVILKKNAQKSDGDKVEPMQS